MTGLIPARKRGRPRRTQEDVAPTPETLAKLQRDQLSDFLKQGELTPNQKRAAPKIYSFYLALKRGMAQQSRLEIGPSVPARSQPQAPLERLSDAESESWCTVYRPWAGGGEPPDPQPPPQADGAQPGWEHRQGESKPRIRIIGL